MCKGKSERLLPWGVEEARSLARRTLDAEEATLAKQGPGAMEAKSSGWILGSGALPPLNEGPLKGGNGSCSTGAVILPVAGLNEPGGVRRRADFPEVRPYKRGCLADALKLARCPAALQAAVEKFDKDIYAASSGGTRVAMLGTLNKIAEACGKVRCTRRTLLPLTEESFRPVVAVLKGAGYRAASCYVTLALQEHVEAGHNTTEQLERFLEKARASITRGLGPPARAGHFELLDLKDKVEELLPAKGGPAQAGRAIVLATWCLLREIEAAAITMQQVAIIHDGTVLQLAFGPTKADTKGFELVRFFGCVRGVKDSSWAPLCPVEIAKKQLEERSAQGASDSCPFFPDCEGEFSSKDGWIGTLRDSVTAVKGVLNGHSMRRAGVKMYAMWGMAKWKIQFLSRHSSDAVEAYLEEAYAELAAQFPVEALRAETENSLSLAQLKDLVKEALEEEELVKSKDELSKDSKQVKLMKAAIGEVNKVKAEWQATLASMKQDEAKAVVSELLQEDNGVKELEGQIEFERRVRRKQVHIIAIGDTAVPHTEWKALCGRKFGNCLNRGQREGCKRHADKPDDPKERCTKRFDTQAAHAEGEVAELPTGPPGKSGGRAWGQVGARPLPIQLRIHLRIVWKRWNS